MAEGAAWDVAVIGGGPAGLTAARSTAAAGLRTVLLERAAYPRYKTCGGGLIGASLAALPPRMAVPVRDQIEAVTFTYNGRRRFTRRYDGRPLLAMVRREDFDHALAHAAEQAGAVIRPLSTVRGIEESPELVTVRLADGQTVRASYAIGADGSAGITSRHAGVRLNQVDLGLEVELPASAAIQRQWAGRLLVDWGPLPGSYGWVFPKADQLTVGVIAARGQGELTRRYLRDLLARLGLSGIEPRHDTGHLTRCRTDDSPLGTDRLLVAGDAAGLLEPWTREGISFALRSGAFAAEAVTATAAAGGVPALPAYRAEVQRVLLPEIRAGRRLLALFTRRPALLHAVLATPSGWRMFARFCLGQANLAEAADRLTARVALALLRA